MRALRFPAVGILALAVVAGCEAEPEADVPEVEPSQPAQPAQTAQPTLPDTTAQAVWSYLQEVGYADAWDHWPDREPLYPGAEPHGALLSTYLNSAAMDALSGGDLSEMPDGAIVVKENHMPDSTLAAVTVMYKSQGFAPDAGNWWWAKYGAEGDVQAAGHAQGCLQCHSQAAETHDYLITAMQDDSG